MKQPGSLTTSLIAIVWTVAGAAQRRSSPGLRSNEVAFATLPGSLGMCDGQGEYAHSVGNVVRH